MNPIVCAIVFAIFVIKFVACLECKSEVSFVFEKNKRTHHYLGCEIENWKGEKCTAFRGIRYAKPPINELRFKDPQPIEIPSFEDARNDGPDCSSIFSKNSSEDCLFLNVYSKTNSSNLYELRPVIVFIHPGGLYIGSGSSSFLGPEYLLEKDLIIVTFNHRLGSMGFLNLGTSSIPGNAGLKDQVMAMRWVKENILYFGGNPKNITLMGYSAGAVSVCLHLASPMSQGLFQKAIIMSGSIPPQTKIPRNNQIELAKKQSLLMSCKEESLLNLSEGIQNCLSQFTGWEIAKTLRKMFHFGLDNPIYLWLPVIEEDFGQERFLIEDPNEAFQFGRFAKVPILIGFNNGEFCTSAKDIFTSETLLHEFQQDFDRLAPICFMYSDYKNEHNLTQALLLEYLGKNDTSFSKMQFEGLCDLFSDSIIRFGVHRLATLAAKYVNVFPYKFSYKGTASYLNYPGHNTVEHMDDLMYLFKMPLKQFTPTDSESKVVETMVDFFTKFAENGKPETNTEFKMNKFVEISDKVEVMTGPYFEKYSFWENITKY